MKLYPLLLLLMLGLALQAAAQDPVNPKIEQQLENLAEADEQATEDDNYYQTLNRFRLQPLDINAATRNDMAAFRWLTELQVDNLIRYRSRLGALVSLYELQAVPGWDIETIQRTLPFIYAGDGKPMIASLKQRFAGGDQILLLRVGQTLEKSRGYLPKDTLPAPYPGSPQRVFLRYNYNYRGKLLFGVLGEKDPGEQFFKGAQRLGFDHYGFHFFARDIGKVKLLAIGDYTVNMGQGLLTYQSLAFRKSADVMGIKRQTEIFRPYNSPAEFNFQRGAAISMRFGKIDVSFFGSRIKRSANVVADTLSQEDFVSSIIESGLHRTAAEVKDRKSLLETAAGGAIHYKGEKLRLGINAVHYRFDKLLERNLEPYNLFQFNGKKLTGLSFEGSYTYRNLHLFGELAANPKGGKAFIGGAVASLDPKVDFSLVTRLMDKNYHSLYGNAFTESTTPANEKGIYFGLAIRPKATLRFDLYADFYQSPWLRFRISRPGWGKDFLFQLTWRPNKQVELYSRFRFEEKPLDYSLPDLAAKQTENIPRRNWRTQLQWRASPQITIRTRAEAMWWDGGGPEDETGFMVFSDIFYKPALASRWQLSGRLCYFETDGYNSRIYAYENDVLYSFSIPPLFGKGFRYYANAQADLIKGLTLYFRFAKSHLPQNESIGSGLDEIEGNSRTDYRIQLVWRWK